MSTHLLLESTSTSSCLSPSFNFSLSKGGVTELICAVNATQGQFALSVHTSRKCSCCEMGVRPRPHSDLSLSYSHVLFYPSLIRSHEVMTPASL